MTENTLWQLAELLLPLQQEMRQLRGTVGKMRAGIEGAQESIHALRDEVRCAQKTPPSDALREELRAAQHTLRGFRNDLRYVRALNLRQADSLCRIAAQLVR